MAVTLIDANVLLRLLQPRHPQYSIAAAAVAELRKQRADLCVAPQNLVEFWVVATRPVVNNGLGMSPLKPGVAGAWRMLVGAAGQNVLPAASRRPRTPSNELRRSSGVEFRIKL